MRNIIDIIGKRFGRLVVIKLDHVENKYGSFWECLCDCGNIKIIKAGSLKNGSTKSCGCLQKEKPHERIKDLTGKRFGRLLVLRMVKVVKKNYRVHWECLCDCGNKKIIDGSGLKSGFTRSCGCLRKRRKTDLVGEVFNRLTVIDFAYVRNKKNYWKCICICGKTVMVSTNALRSGNTKSCGCIALNPNTAFNDTFSSYRGQALSRGFSFEIDKDEFRNITQQNCYYCGIEPKQVKKARKQNYIYNGIDRIDSSKGYIKGNIVPCCGQCNYSKGVKTTEEFFSWIKKVYNFHLDKMNDL